DLAGAYFVLGWRQRAASASLANNTIVCAVRLAEIYAFADPFEPFWQHLDEVDGFLASPGNVAATSNFFDTVLKLAELPHLQSHRAELRDRSRLALAGKLRQHSLSESRPGAVVSELFGKSRHWPAAVVSDSNFALRSALKEVEPAKRAD